MYLSQVETGAQIPDKKSYAPDKKSYAAPNHGRVFSSGSQRSDRGEKIVGEFSPLECSLPEGTQEILPPPIDNPLVSAPQIHPSLPLK